MRSFIAVDIDANDRIRRLLRALGGLAAPVKVVPPESLHITLKFLGEVEEGRVDGLTAALASCVDGLEPFALTFRGTGAFPRMSSPRVVWIGVEDADPLVAYARRAEDALEALGFDREKRPFSPHLTVGRVKGSRGRRALTDLLAAHREEPFGQQRVEAVKLKKSELRPTGAAYSDVARVGLG